MKKLFAVMLTIVLVLMGLNIPNNTSSMEAGYTVATVAIHAEVATETTAETTESTESTTINRWAPHVNFVRKHSNRAAARRAHAKHRRGAERRARHVLIRQIAAIAVICHASLTHGKTKPSEKMARRSAEAAEKKTAEQIELNRLICAEAEAAWEAEKSAKSAAAKAAAKEELDRRVAKHAAKVAKANKAKAVAAAKAAEKPVGTIVDEATTLRLNKAKAVADAKRRIIRGPQETHYESWQIVSAIRMHRETKSMLRDPRYADCLAEAKRLDAVVRARKAAEETERAKREAVREAITAESRWNKLHGASEDIITIRNSYKIGAKANVLKALAPLGIMLANSAGADAYITTATIDTTATTVTAIALTIGAIVIGIVASMMQKPIKVSEEVAVSIEAVKAEIAERADTISTSSISHFGSCGAASKVSDPAAEARARELKTINDKLDAINKKLREAADAEEASVMAIRVAKAECRNWVNSIKDEISATKEDIEYLKQWREADPENWDVFAQADLRNASQYLRSLQEDLKKLFRAVTDARKAEVKAIEHVCDILRLRADVMLKKDIFMALCGINWSACANGQLVVEAEPVEELSDAQKEYIQKRHDKRLYDVEQFRDAASLMAKKQPSLLVNTDNLDVARAAKARKSEWEKSCKDKRVQNRCAESDIKSALDVAQERADKAATAQFGQSLAVTAAVDLNKEQSTVKGSRVTAQAFESSEFEVACGNIVRQCKAKMEALKAAGKEDTDQYRTFEYLMLIATMAPSHLVHVKWNNAQGEESDQKMKKFYEDRILGNKDLTIKVQLSNKRNDVEKYKVYVCAMLPNAAKLGEAYWATDNARALLWAINAIVKNEKDGKIINNKMTNLTLDMAKKGKSAFDMFGELADADCVKALGMIASSLKRGYVTQEQLTAEEIMYVDASTMHGLQPRELYDLQMKKRSILWETNKQDWEDGMAYFFGRMTKEVGEGVHQVSGGMLKGAGQFINDDVSILIHMFPLTDWANHIVTTPNGHKYSFGRVGEEFVNKVTGKTETIRDLALISAIIPYSVAKPLGQGVSEDDLADHWCNGWFGGRLTILHLLKQSKDKSEMQYMHARAGEPSGQQVQGLRIDDADWAYAVDQTEETIQAMVDDPALGCAQYSDIVELYPDFTNLKQVYNTWVANIQRSVQSAACGHVFEYDRTDYIAPDPFAGLAACLGIAPNEVIYGLVDRQIFSRGSDEGMTDVRRDPSLSRFADYIAIQARPFCPKKLADVLYAKDVMYFGVFGLSRMLTRTETHYHKDGSEYDVTVEFGIRFSNRLTEMNGRNASDNDGDKERQKSSSEFIYSGLINMQTSPFFAEAADLKAEKDDRNVVSKKACLRDMTTWAQRFYAAKAGNQIGIAAKPLFALEGDKFDSIFAYSVDEFGNESNYIDDVAIELFGTTILRHEVADFVRDDMEQYGEPLQQLKVDWGKHMTGNKVVKLHFDIERMTSALLSVVGQAWKRADKRAEEYAAAQDPQRNGGILFNTYKVFNWRSSVIDTKIVKGKEKKFHMPSDTKGLVGSLNKVYNMVNDRFLVPIEEQDEEDKGRTQLRAKFMPVFQDEQSCRPNATFFMNMKFWLINGVKWCTNDIIDLPVAAGEKSGTFSGNNRAVRNGVVEVIDVTNTKPQTVCDWIIDAHENWQTLKSAAEETSEGNGTRYTKGAKTVESVAATNVCAASSARVYKDSIRAYLESLKKTDEAKYWTIYMWAMLEMMTCAIADNNGKRRPRWAMNDPWGAKVAMQANGNIKEMFVEPNVEKQNGWYVDFIMSFFQSDLVAMLKENANRIAAKEDALVEAGKLNANKRITEAYCTNDDGTIQYRFKRTKPVDKKAKVSDEAKARAAMFAAVAAGMDDDEDDED